MSAQPSLGHVERHAPAHGEADARERDRRPGVVEEHGQAQREQLQPHVVVGERRTDLGEPAAAAEDEQREASLFA